MTEVWFSLTCSNFLLCCIAVHCTPYIVNIHLYGKCVYVQSRIYCTCNLIKSLHPGVLVFYSTAQKKCIHLCTLYMYMVYVLSSLFLSPSFAPSLSPLLPLFLPPFLSLTECMVMMILLLQKIVWRRLITIAMQSQQDLGKCWSVRCGNG